MKFRGMVLLTTALVLGAIYQVFLVAPVEEQMGIVQKIFYFHVPSAYAMYVGFLIAAVGSAGYLYKRDDRWDAIAVSGAEVGVLFCAIVMATGPLWARKAWGVWWTWDPRLTSTMLGGMIYVAYLALRGFGTVGEVEKRFAAALALAGIPNAVIIHYSVQRWRGQHPTVITNKGGGLDPEMKMVLLFCFVAFTALVITLVWARVRVERQSREISSLRLRAARRGLLEDS